MTTPLSLRARKAQMLGMRAGLDAGGAKALFYTGTPPDEPDLPTTETLLGTVALPTPCGTLSDANSLALLTLAVPRTTLAVESGVIGFVRLTDGTDGNDGSFLDLEAGLLGSGKPAILNVLQVFTGGEIQLIACVLAA